MKLSLALCLLAAGAASAQPAGSLDGSTLRRLTQSGPFRVELGDKAKLRVPDNLRYVTADKLEGFAEKMRLPLVGDEVGVVIPEDTSWHAIVFLLKDDPLAGQADLANLDKSALMAWTEKFTADHTSRKAGTGKTYKIGNWTHPPKWDAERKTHEMGVRMDSDSGEFTANRINHKLFVYGPEKQIVCFQTVGLLSDYEKPVSRVRKLAAEELEFPKVYAEGEGEDQLMYYAKLAGGGLLGTLLVVVIAKLVMGGSRRAPQMGSVRRPGLPR